MCKWWANRNPCAGYRITDHHVPLTPPNRGVEKSPFQNQLQPTNWRLTKMSTMHILGYIGWLRSDTMNVQLSPNPRMSERRSSTICTVVVERFSRASKIILQLAFSGCRCYIGIAGLFWSPCLHLSYVCRVVYCGQTVQDWSISV